MHGVRDVRHPLRGVAIVVVERIELADQLIAPASQQGCSLREQQRARVPDIDDGGDAQGKQRCDAQQRRQFCAQRPIGEAGKSLHVPQS